MQPLRHINPTSWSPTTVYSMNPFFAWLFTFRNGQNSQNPSTACSNSSRWTTYRNQKECNLLQEIYWKTQHIEGGKKLVRYVIVLLDPASVCACNTWLQYFRVSGHHLPLLSSCCQSALVSGLPDSRQEDPSLLPSCHQWPMPRLVFCICFSLYL